MHLTILKAGVKEFRNFGIVSTQKIIELHDCRKLDWPMLIWLSH